MKFYKYAGNIKAGLFIIGISLVICLLTYTQILVKELRNDNREIVRLYASMIAQVVHDDNDTNLDFIFEEIIKKVKFPLIVTDSEHYPETWRNLPSSYNQDTIKVIKYMDMADENNSPIPLIYKDNFTLGYLHYGDSAIVEKLQIWSYVEIIAIGLFIFLGFSGFSFIRNNEKKHIWVGMARETAHQLGTPVSALMGWIDRLKAHPEKIDDILPEIELDIQRLQQIGRRFSKMGSNSNFKELDLSSRIERIVDYLNKRLPTLGKKVELINDIHPSIIITANGSLLAWSIENIIRNGIDAIECEDGKINISLRKNDNGVIIRIKDNGIGIPKKDWKNIFRPGFTTKKGGWGLGLSLASRIIEEIHGGTLKIVDSSIDDGTILEISL
tara:strand:- start:67 stop:1221 length:1155 start_codon:yes stop_codon:yes gene_type:complete